MKRVKKPKIVKKREKISPNEKLIDLQDKKLKKIIKVIRPSRSSTIYDRME